MHFFKTYFTNFSHPINHQSYKSIFMKKLVHLFFFLAAFLMSVPSQAQLSILFVDDSDDTYMNSEGLQAGLTDAGVTFTVWDAQGMEIPPTAADMNAYDLVIWDTGSQGFELYFWNAADVVNTEIQAYLDQGGNMILTGNDFFFDRYGPFSSAIDFVAGDFEYDYMGLESFDAETYTSDGETGVPFMRPVMDQPIPGLNDISFIFSTLWYADAVTPRAEAVALYEFGGDGTYALEGDVCGVWYDNGTSIFVTFTFAMSVAGNLPADGANLKAVIDFLEMQVVNTSEVHLANLNAVAYPNPASDVVNILLETNVSGTIQLQVTDALGRVVNSVQTQLPAGMQQVAWNIPQNLANGMYQIHLQTEEGMQTLKVNLLR
jgi:hypothetical protein